MALTNREMDGKMPSAFPEFKGYMRTCQKQDRMVKSQRV